MSEDNGYEKKVDDLQDLDGLQPIEIRFNLEGKPHVLVEASADSACRWRNEVMKTAKLRNGKVSEVGNLADTEPLLVSLCLFKIEEDGKQVDGFRRVRYDIKEVRRLPARVVKRLFAKCIEIGNLKETPDGEEDPSKKPASATADTWS